MSACRRVGDWDRFVGWWLRHHRTLPLVYRRLKTDAWHAVPPQARRHLEQHAKLNAPRHMAKAVTLVQICRLLSSRDLPCLAFKGPTLALRAYGSLALRQAGDLDLLVDPDRIGDADRALRAAGYRLTQPAFEMSPRQRRVFREVWHHLVHRTPDDSTDVELHWRLGANPALLPLSFADLRARARTQVIGGYAVPTLSDLDLALYLFGHGAAHAWFRLFWLCDVVAFLERTAVSWGDVLAHGRAHGLSRPVLQGAVLAHELLGCPVPGPVLAEAGRRDSGVGALLRVPMERLGSSAPEPVGVVGRFRGTLVYPSRLRRDPAYKLSVVRALCLNALEDWRDVPLPDRLFPLYYLIRVPAWCLRRWFAR